MNLSLYGTQYGGFYYPKDIDLNENSIIYCIGVGEDISHDVMLGHTSKAPIYLFDPTPRAEKHVQQVKEVLETKNKPQYNKKIGGGAKNYWDIILKNQISPNNIHFYPFGLYTEDTELKFYMPKIKEHVSCSLNPNMKNVNTNDYINVPVKKLSSIMKMLNHDKIDLLKIDIEGVECQVIEQMLEENIYPKYLAIDFDTARMIKNGITIVNSCILKLIKLGYKILKNTRYDITFIKK